MSAKGQVRNSIHTVLSHNMNTLSTDYHYGVMDIGDAGSYLSSGAEQTLHQIFIHIITGIAVFK